LLGTDGVAVLNDPVPGSGGEASITALAGAVEDGLRGDDGVRRGLTGNAETVSERLHGAEVPARPTLLLVEDEEVALFPVGARIKGTGDVGGAGKNRQGSEKNNL